MLVAPQTWFILTLVCLSSSQLQQVGPQVWLVKGNASTNDVINSLDRDGHLDVWGGSKGTLQVVVEPKYSALVERVLKEANIEHSLAVEDLFSLIRQERNFLQQRKERRKRQATQDGLDWSVYHELPEIEDYILRMNRSLPNLVTAKVVAMTEERNPVYVVRVADPTTPGPKKRIWIEGGIHAREWISPAVTTFLMNEVVTNPQWRDILQSTEWFFVPVANPDGYQYTFTSDRARMWRKNRKSNGLFGMCKGVDLNRNWDLKWGVGASTNPCSETYRGPQVFSEPETNGLRDAMEMAGPLELFITFHSFGQTVLYPWGWTADPPSNVKQLNRVARKFMDAVKESSKGETIYETGSSGPLYGLASGATDDWAYGALAVPYSYTIELPDHGTYGFLLPENQVHARVLETAVGMHCMLGFLTNTGNCARSKRRSQNPLNRHFRAPASPVIFRP